MNITLIADAEKVLGGIVLILSIIIGLVNCFYGYRMHRAWIAFICSFIGIVSGYVACMAAVKDATIAIAVLIGVALGALLAFLSIKVAKADVFLFAAGISFWSCVLLLSRMGSLAAMIIGIVVGILMGLLAIKFTRIVLILATAISGGLSAVQALLLLLPFAALQEMTWLPIAAGSLLTAVGVFLQYQIDIRTRRMRKLREKARAAREAARKEAAWLGNSVQREFDPRGVLTVVPDLVPSEENADASE